MGFRQTYTIACLDGTTHRIQADGYEVRAQLRVEFSEMSGGIRYTREFRDTIVFDYHRRGDDAVSAVITLAHSLDQINLRNALLRAIQKQLLSGHTLDVHDAFKTAQRSLKTKSNTHNAQAVLFEEAA